MTIALIHVAATLFLGGLIWFVQVVHYPLFHTARPAFPGYEREHQRRTGWVVGPPMLTELASAVLLALAPPPSVGRLVPLIGLGLVALVWLSTALLQIPCHRRLAAGYDAAAARRLVGGNWLRTVAWTARAPIVLWILVRSVD